MPKTEFVDSPYPNLLLVENQIELLEPFKGTKIHHQMKCLVCNHVWSATPLSKRQAFKKYHVSGCPHCNTNKRNTQYQVKRDTVLDALSMAGLEILSDYNGSQTTTQLVTFRNIHCGHVFDTYPGNVIQLKTKCTICGKQDRVKTITAWSKANSVKWKETATEWQQYKALVSSLTTHNYRIHKNTINPLNLHRGKAGQAGAYHLDHIIPKRFCFDNNIPPEVCADPSNLQMLHWEDNVGSRNHIKGNIPPLFLNFISSDSKMSQYGSFLLKIFPAGKLFTKINDTVVTMFDEESNHAVFVLPLDASQANSKTAKLVRTSLINAGVSFTILFEDELTNENLIYKKLVHYTHNNKSTRIHARECDIRQISNEDKRLLLNTHHVQGNDNAALSYGAFWNDIIVAVMTFSKPRVALGQKGLNSSTSTKWELSRFVTNTDYRIPGIASKLLKHFERNNTWTEIYSYADKRWSTGNMYIQLNFTLVADNPPDYFYVINGARKHRWNYRKDILKHKLANYNPLLTEYQNMVNHGYYRVWDCGTLKFTKINNIVTP